MEFDTIREQHPEVLLPTLNVVVARPCRAETRERLPPRLRWGAATSA